MSMDTIRIAGAGLAGLSAAIGLARSGYRVEVFEKNADSGQARHPEWDGIENWTTETDLLTLLGEWGIAPHFEYRSCLNFEVYDQDGVCYPVTTPRPLLYMLKRGPEQGSLEQSLKTQAQDHGVMIHYDQPRASKEVDIWAVGAQHKGLFLGVGLTFRTKHPDIVIGLFNTFSAPKAYAYLVIVQGQATISVVLTRDFNQARLYLNRSVETFRRLKQFEMSDVRMSSGAGGLISAFWQSASHPLVVGEAAGFQDFLWGFGIRYALHSGHLAARAIAEGLDYEALVAREIRPQVRASLVNRTLYDWAGNRTYRLLIKRFSASPNLPHLIRKWYRRSAVNFLLWPLAKRRYYPRRSPTP